MKERTIACRRVVPTDFGTFTYCTRKNCTFAHSLEEYCEPKCRYESQCRSNMCNFRHPDETSGEFRDRIALSLPEKRQYAVVPIQVQHGEQLLMMRTLVPNLKKLISMTDGHFDGPCRDVLITLTELLGEKCSFSKLKKHLEQYAFLNIE